MDKYAKSKTSLFLMEIIITVLFFCICSAICMKLFVGAHVLEKKTFELNHAVEAAQGFSEVMRGTDGNIDSIVEVYPKAVKGADDFFEVFYDENFVECEFQNATYAADITLEPNGAIQNMEVTVFVIETYEEIYNLTATKYMNDVKG